MPFVLTVLAFLIISLFEDKLSTTFSERACIGHWHPMWIWHFHHLPFHPVTVWAERRRVSRRCERLWHPRNLHRRLQSGRVEWKFSQPVSETLSTFFFFPFLQCPHNVHKLDGYLCDNSQVRAGLWHVFQSASHSDAYLRTVSCRQGRCYGGRCRTHDGQCRGLWGYSKYRMLPPPGSTVLLHLRKCEYRDRPQHLFEIQLWMHFLELLSIKSSQL